MLHQLATAAMLAIGLTTSQFVPADPLAYQNRGDRMEGIRSKPVAGENIELISVRATPVGGSTDSFSDKLRISFFLPEESPVNLTIRELDYKHYYWLDQVTPKRPWQPNKTNKYVWPTSDVIQQLEGLEPTELGALVRLTDSGKPTAREQVTPAVISSEEVSVNIQALLFTFRTNMPARLRCRLYLRDSDQVLWGKTFKRVSAIQPFTCRVPVKIMQYGYYRLVVNGYSLDTNDPLDQVVIFFYNPNLG